MTAGDTQITIAGNLVVASTRAHREVGHGHTS